MSRLSRPPDVSRAAENENPGDSAPSVPISATTPDIPAELTVLPTQDGVLFPGMGMPALIAGQPMLGALEAAMATEAPVAIVAHKPEEEGAPSRPGPPTSEQDGRPPESPPSPDSLYRVATAARIARLVPGPQGGLHAVFQGLARVRITDFVQTEPHLRAAVETLREPTIPPTPEVEALRRMVVRLIQQIVSLSPTIPDGAAAVAASLSDPGAVADLACALLDLPIAEKQRVLETLDPGERLRLAADHLDRERQVLEIGHQAAAELSGKVNKAQREAFLRAELEKIQNELGQLDSQQATAQDLTQRFEKADLPEEVRKEAERELARFSRLPEMSPEYHLIRTYLDWLLELPWKRSTDDHLDLDHARTVLDEDHYGLDKVKERILEYLAVRKLKSDPRGPILCFVGAPGVGKTSLGQSIARALGRKFARISLGGVRDEAEIRGHRRTYVGALPGRIIQAMRRAESNNPVFMLDEVDKLAVGFQGDPAAALLEVLDPEQNHAFVDHYLDVPFDLSRVLFIATANVLDSIPAPLRDRMEITELPGYTEEEKVEITRRHLLPKQLEAHGLRPDQLDLTDEVLRRVIHTYTREAGVRNLERELATLCRKVARQLVEAGESEASHDASRPAIRVMPRDLAKHLGPRRFRSEVLEEEDEIGVAAGLSWTPAGGEVLFVEANVVPGDGKVELTGQLGDVMKESVKAALTYVRSRAKTLGLPRGFPKKHDVHVHVPAGAVPKDGPSAGVAVAAALASALTRRPIHRDAAMTGEITLRGKVLPIGGVKEKVIAAHRAGVKTVFLPAENEKDLRDERDVPREVVDAIEFVFLTHADELLAAALTPAHRPTPTRKPARKPAVKSALKTVRSPAPLRKAA